MYAWLRYSCMLLWNHEHDVYVKFHWKKKSMLSCIKEAYILFANNSAGKWLMSILSVRKRESPTLIKIFSGFTSLWNIPFLQETNMESLKNLPHLHMYQYTSWALNLKYQMINNKIFFFLNQSSKLHATA